MHEAWLSHMLKSVFWHLTVYLPNTVWARKAMWSTSKGPRSTAGMQARRTLNFESRDSTLESWSLKELLDPLSKAMIWLSTPKTERRWSVLAEEYAIRRRVESICFQISSSSKIQYLLEQILHLRPAEWSWCIGSLQALPLVRQT